MEHDGCVGCKYEHESAESKHCLGCKQNAVDKYTRKTIADDIREMSDEELADYLYRMALCSLTTVKIDNKEIAIPKLLKWLQSEAE